MKKIVLFLFALIIPIVIFSQLENEINTQGVLTNQQALDIAKSLGLKTINQPIESVYSSPSGEMRRKLDKLQLYSMVKNKVISTSIIQVINQASSNKYVAAKETDGITTTTFFACALIEATRVREVRQHQSKRNTQTADIIYKVIDVSNFGQAIGVRLGETFTYTIDFIPTSNGWKPDVASRKDYKITDYRDSNYGKTGIKNYKSAKLN
ncbi:MAG: hypothetical protein V3U80_02205 [Flavobacteriaceae bacterium]